MSGYVMAVLPLMGLALGVGMGADPVGVLLGTPVGNILLLVGVALTCAGLLWSARIVNR
jgi:tight adherence protein B